MTSRTAHWSFAVPPETPYRPLRSKKGRRWTTGGFFGERDRVLMLGVLGEDKKNC